MNQTLSTDPGDDLALAGRIAQGDKAAFTLLMRRHNQRMFRAARSILGNDADAEDALQEAYLQAFRSIANFRGEARLSTWLTRIVVNQALARLRNASRHPEAPPEEDHSDAFGADMNAAESPEQQAIRSQLRAMLERCIDALPDEYRTVFVLRAVEELPGDEVALCLDIPQATVRSRLSRARAHLRKNLQEQFNLAVSDAFAFDGSRCDRIVAATLARLA